MADSCKDLQNEANRVERAKLIDEIHCCLLSIDLVHEPITINKNWKSFDTQQLEKLLQGLTQRFKIFTTK